MHFSLKFLPEYWGKFIVALLSIFVLTFLSVSVFYAPEDPANAYTINAAPVLSVRLDASRPSINLASSPKGTFVVSDVFNAYVHSGGYGKFHSRVDFDSYRLRTDAGNIIETFFPKDGDQPSYKNDVPSGTWGYTTPSLEGQFVSGTEPLIYTTHGSYNSNYEYVDSFQLGAKLSSTQAQGVYYTDIIYTAFLEPQAFSIIYNKNLPTGVADNVNNFPENWSENIIAGSITQTISDKTPTLSDYTFLGWATSPSGEVVYHPNDLLNINASDATVTLYAVWKQAALELPATMQEMTPEICASLPIADTAGNHQYQITDSRDGKKYWIAHLADGNCWMTQNLDLKLDKNIPLTNETTDLNTKSSWAPEYTTKEGTIENIACGEMLDSTYSWDPGDYYWNPQYNSSWNSCGYYQDGMGACENFGLRKSKPTQDNAGLPFDSNTAEHYHVGNLYYWNAVVAGSASQNKDGEINDISDSICPKSWTMPKSLDFEGLLSAYPSITSGNITKAPFYMVNAGEFYCGGYHNGGIKGYYWSGTGSSLHWAIEFEYYPNQNSIVDSSAVSSGTDTGYSARCILNKTIVHTISFNANGGEGTMPNISVEDGKTFTFPENSFTRDGYEFLGWSADASNVSGVLAHPGDTSPAITKDTPFFAIWQPNCEAEYIDYHRIKGIDAGMYNSFAIDLDNHLWAWGFGRGGQLGNNTATSSITPIDITPYFNGATIISVATGTNHSLAIDSRGHLWAWGNNDYGQLGNNSTIRSLAPTDIASRFGGAIIVSATTSSNHSLAIDSNGHLWTWGDNYYGQLGNNDSGTKSLIPIDITSRFNGATLVAVATGSSHSLAIDSNGHLWTWGYNYNGQLGNGSTSSTSIPVDITSRFNGATLVSASAGFGHSLAIDSNGHLWTWGRNSQGQLGNNNSGTNSRIPIDITSSFDGATLVSAFSSIDHLLAIDSDGRLWSWGYNGAGQLGNGSTTDGYIPNNITPYFNGSTIISISAGYRHSLAIDSNNYVWAWGNNGDGELGNGTTENSLIPIKVLNKTITESFICSTGHTVKSASDLGWSNGNLAFKNWTDSAGGNISVGTVIHESKTLTANWGVTHTISFNANGGQGTMSNITVEDGKTFTFPENSFTRDGYEFLGWSADASNVSGVLAHPGDTSPAITKDTPFYAIWKENINNISVTYTDVSHIKQIARGANFAVMLDDMGRIWEWGMGNDNDESSLIYGTALGNGSFNYYWNPIITVDNIRFTKIAAGTYHVAAIDENGDIWTWGSNPYGQLGNGSYQHELYPKKVTTGGGFVDVAASQWSTKALDSTGHLWETGGSGSSYYNSDMTDRKQHTSFTSSSLDVSFSKIEAQNIVVFAIDTAGNLWGWGNNRNGEFGNGEEIALPQITNLSDTYYHVKFKDVSVDYHGTLLLDVDGYLYVTGNNLFGQLGLGDSTIRRTAVKFTDKRYSYIENNSWVSYIVDTDGYLWVAGSNLRNGLLGLGITENDYIVNTFTKVGDKKYDRIIADSFSIFAKTQDGNWYEWGTENFGNMAYRTVNAPELISYKFKETYTLQSKGSQTVLPQTDSRFGFGTHENYTFVKWNTQPDGSGTDYLPGSTISSSETLYTIWEEKEPDLVIHTISFNANGGQGTMSNITVEDGKTFTFPENSFTRDGYEFLGWSADASNVSGVLAHPGDTSPAITKDTPFYAIWRKNNNPFDEAFSDAGKEKQNGYYKMQDTSASICNAVPTPTTTTEDISTQLIDTRDNKVYWINKLKDGNCWMTQNLDYDIKATNNEVAVIGGTTTTWNSSYPAHATETTLSSHTENTGTYSWDPGDYYIVNGGKDVSTACTTWRPTSTCEGTTMLGYDLTSASAKGNQNLHYHLGNYYQWNTATAGYGGTETSKDISYSICPKGWRLPTSGSYTDNYSFGKLTNAYGITDNNIGSNGVALLSSPLWFVRAGQADDRLLYQGTIGRVWSSRADSDVSKAYNLQFAASVTPSDNFIGSYRPYGFSVRCVADATIIHTISFNANGGQGTMSNISVEDGKTFTFPENSFTRDGYEFLGWSADASNVSGVLAHPGDTSSAITKDTPFYAIWKEKAPACGIDLPYMQDLNSAYYSSMPQDTNITVCDKRDNKAYTIAKLSDGNIWMTSDLNLNLNSSIALTSDLTDIHSTTSIAPPRVNNTSNYMWTEATLNPSGNYAGKDAPDSICPAGWRLPSYSGSSSYNYQYLLDNYSETDLSSLIKLGNNEGYWQSISTIYSTATISPEIRGYILYMPEKSDSYVRSNSSPAKVRCVARLREEENYLYKIIFLNDADKQLTTYNKASQEKSHSISSNQGYYINTNFSKDLGFGKEHIGWSTTKSSSTPEYYLYQQYTLSSEKPQIILHPVYSEFTYLGDMQTATPDIVNTMTLGGSYVMRDQRDGKYYHVGRLEDGNIWMLQNLDLDLSTTTTLTPNDTDVIDNWTPPTSTDKDVKIAFANMGETTVSSFDYQWPFYFNPTTRYSSAISLDTQPFLLHTGNHYSYYAATATTGRNGVAPTSSICPINWTLPTSNHIDNLINVASLTPTNVRESNFHGTPSGYASSASYYNSSTASYWWTKSIDSSSYPVFLHSDFSSILGGRIFKTSGYGLSIRCIYSQKKYFASLSFDKNTTDSVSNMPSNQNIEVSGNTSHTFSLSGIPTPTRQYYTFLGWATTSSATTPNVSGSITVSANKPVTLYAVWSPNTCKVTYHHGIDPNSTDPNDTETVSFLCKDGHELKTNKYEDTEDRKFLYWSLEKSYNYGESIYAWNAGYTINISYEVYAFWDVKHTININSNDTRNRNHTIDITGMRNLINYNLIINNGNLYVNNNGTKVLISNSNISSETIFGTYSQRVVNGETRSVKNIGYTTDKDGYLSNSSLVYGPDKDLILSFPGSRLTSAIYVAWQPGYLWSKRPATDVAYGIGGLEIAINKQGDNVRGYLDYSSSYNYDIRTGIYSSPSSSSRIEFELGREKSYYDTAFAPLMKNNQYVLCKEHSQADSPMCRLPIDGDSSKTLVCGIVEFADNSYYDSYNATSQTYIFRNVLVHCDSPSPTELTGVYFSENPNAYPYFGIATENNIRYFYEREL